MSDEDITRIGDPIPWFADADGEINVVVYKSLSGFSPCFPAVALLSLGTHGVKDDPCANLSLAQLDALIGKLATARVLLLAAAAEASPGDHEISRDGAVDVALPAPVLADLAALRDHLTTLVNVPRDAARAAADLVTRDDELLLVKTTLGEWGVGSEDEPAGEVTWFGGEHAEYDARRLFAEERGKVACLGCAVEVDEDDSSPATDDGDRYCPTCAKEAKDEFNATTFGHDRGWPGEYGCAWTGPGSKIVDFDEDALCPACGAPVQRVAMAAPASDAVVTP